MNSEEKRIAHTVYMRGWRKRNPESFKRSQEKYLLAHPDKKYQFDAKKRDNRLFGGKRQVVLDRDGWACRVCGMSNKEHIRLWNRELTIDHIDGKGLHSRIKNNDLGNLMTLCLRCHGKKDVARRGVNTL